MRIETSKTAERFPIVAAATYKSNHEVMEVFVFRIPSDLIGEAVYEANRGICQFECVACIDWNNSLAKPSEELINSICETAWENMYPDCSSVTRDITIAAKLSQWRIGVLHSYGFADDAICYGTLFAPIDIIHELNRHIEKL